MNMLKKMDKSDWVFLFVWIVGSLALAIALDVVLNLVDGNIIAILGPIFGGLVLGKRLEGKK